MPSRYLERCLVRDLTSRTGRAGRALPIRRRLTQLGVNFPLTEKRVYRELAIRQALYLPNARLQTRWTSKQPANDCCVGRVDIYCDLGSFFADWMAALIAQKWIGGTSCLRAVFSLLYYS
jgi:hypothetical protein